MAQNSYASIEKNLIKIYSEIKKHTNLIKNYLKTYATYLNNKNSKFLL